MTSLPRLIYAASNRCAPLLYESGFNAEDPFLWFATDKINAMAVSSLELGRARKQCRPGVRVIDSGKLRQELGLPPAAETAGAVPGTARRIAIVAEATEERHWQVPADFPLALARELENECGLTLTPVSDFCPARRIKTMAEIEAIRRAQRLAEAGLAKADAILAASEIGNDGLLYCNGEILTAEHLRGEINAEIVRRGGNPSGTITAPGSQGADPHQAGTGPIAAHSPVVMDIFPRDEQSGYFGDLTRTRVKGHASDEIRKAYQTVLNAQEAALAMLKPGMECASVHNMVAGYFQKQGYQSGYDASSGAYYGFFHGLGHSVGLEIHEEPGLRPPDHTVLQCGHVVTVEPGLYYPAWGGIRIEDTVALTENGVDNLTTAGKFLEIE